MITSIYPNQTFFHIMSFSQWNNILINDDVFNHANTLMFMLSIINHIKNKKIKIYVVYEIFRYIEYIHDMSYFKYYDAFVMTVLTKIYEFRKDFINDFKSYIPKYFKNIIFAIFDNLIILLENQ